MREMRVLAVDLAKGPLAKRIAKLLENGCMSNKNIFEDIYTNIIIESLRVIGP
jgi:hypothetical protein